MPFSFHSLNAEITSFMLYKDIMFRLFFFISLVDYLLTGQEIVQYIYLLSKCIALLCDNISVLRFFLTDDNAKVGTRNVLPRIVKESQLDWNTM